MSPCCRTHFFLCLKILMINQTIKPNTITSPNTAIRPTPEIMAPIRTAIAMAMTTASKIVKVIILALPFIIESVNIAN